MVSSFSWQDEPDPVMRCLPEGARWHHLAHMWLPAVSHRKICIFSIYRGYYTVARRYEFYFWVAKQYFTNKRSEWVKYCFCHEKIKFISSSRRVMFFLLYRHADDGVFDDFPKIFDHLPKISEDFPKLFRIPDERSRTFSDNFRKFPKMSEDCRRLPRKTRRCFDDAPTNLRTI